MDIINRLNGFIKANIPCALLTITRSEGSGPSTIGDIMTVALNGETAGTIGGGNLEHMAVKEALECMASGESREVEYNLKKDADMTCGGAVSVFIKVFAKNPALYVVGAGHIGKELYALGVMFGFSVTIIDDRADMADKNLFPDAADVVCGDVLNVLSGMNFDEKSYVAIATRSHQTDETALKAVAESSAGYVGMIGSTAKIKKIMSNLINEGVSENALKKVFAPMGLNIADTNPKEIALSIMSEIMLVKNGGTPEHYSKIKKIWS